MLSYQNTLIQSNSMHMSAQTWDTPLDLFRLLAHEVRWALLAELAYGDWRVGELAAHLARPQNLVSYHLGQLRGGGLVRERRSAADARDIYYSLDLERLAERLGAAGRALHPSLAFVAGRPAPVNIGEPTRVLFLCTHNSARSQMAEALLRAAAGGRVVAASAGTEPTALHPLAARVLAERGLDSGGQRSKHVDGLAQQPWDRVITVCDQAREVCPAFPATRAVTHWSVRDPSAVGGAEVEQLAAFRQTADELARRVRYLLPILLVNNEGETDE